MKKLNIIFLSVLFTAISLFFACEKDQEYIEEKQETITPSETCESQQEFFSLLTDEQKKKVYSVAREAFNQKDPKILDNYLIKNNLYDDYHAILKKHNLDGKQVRLKSIPSNFFEDLKTGDIVLLTTPWGYVPILGTYSHGGIIDKDFSDPSRPILSASPNTEYGWDVTSLFGYVGYESLTNWCNETNVVALRVQGRTDAKARAAVAYGRQFLGRNYNLLTTREDNVYWYCTKLVWRCWLSQGINIEPAPSSLDNFVSPQDLFDDNDTYYLKGLFGYVEGQYGPVGGNGGNQFNCYMSTTPTEWQRLKKIEVWSGSFVDAFRLTWKNSNGTLTPTQKYGGDGGTYHTWTLDDDEYIYKVQVKYGLFIDRITFYTNKRTMAYGGNPLFSNTYTQDFGNRECHGFFGKGDWYIDQIGFYTYSKSDVGR